MISNTFDQRECAGNLILRGELIFSEANIAVVHCNSLDYYYGSKSWNWHNFKRTWCQLDISVQNLLLPCWSRAWKGLALLQPQLYKCFVISRWTSSTPSAEEIVGVYTGKVGWFLLNIANLVFASVSGRFAFLPPGVTKCWTFDRQRFTNRRS